MLDNRSGTRCAYDKKRSDNMVKEFVANLFSMFEDYLTSTITNAVDKAVKEALENKKEPVEVEEKILNTRDVAKMLRTSEASVYRMVKEKLIPAYTTTGKKFHFKKTDIDSYIQQTYYKLS